MTPSYANRRSLKWMWNRFVLMQRQCRTLPPPRSFFLFSLWKGYFCWEFFLIRCEVLGPACRMCTDCKALWGKFVICDIGLYKINWIELTENPGAFMLAKFLFTGLNNWVKPDLFHYLFDHLYCWNFNAAAFLNLNESGMMVLRRFSFLLSSDCATQTRRWFTFLVLRKVKTWSPFSSWNQWFWVLF